MKKFGSLLLIVCFLGLFSPSQGQNSFARIELKNLDGETGSLGAKAGEKATIIFFLSADCPLCENYSVTINELHKEYSAEEVVFMGIFAGKYVVEQDVRKYLQEFKPAVEVFLDPQYKKTKKLGATITPEVFAFDAEGELFYQKKIDNWLASLGKYRTNITRHYLKDALEAQLSGKPVPLAKTEAVGCFIE